jgi:mevalonate kinase
MSLEIVLELGSSSTPRRNKNISSSENLQHVLHDALELLNLNPVEYRMEGHSKILLGAGMGGSAALCVAMLRALTQSYGQMLSVHELASLANQLEKRFHGTPSGLDTATVAFEKALLFKKHQRPQCLKIQNIDAKYSWPFAIIDSGTRSPTLTMVQQSAPYFQGSKGLRRISQFDTLAVETARGLEEGDVFAVQSSMEKAHILLKEIGVVPPMLEEMIETTKLCGALSAKITGAGGGGCILSLLDPQSAAQTLTQLRQVFGSSKVYETNLEGY